MAETSRSVKYIITATSYQLQLGYGVRRIGAERAWSPRMATMSKTVSSVTGRVVTVNVALAAPAGTVTVGGGVASELLVRRVKTMAASAGPVSRIVPCAF